MELGRTLGLGREETRPKRNVARFRQGRKRNIQRKEDQPTSHKKRKERSHLKEKDIQFLIAQSKLQPNKQAKLQRKPARSTLVVQTYITQANAEERAKRMMRNEEEEAYL
jgi:hypothetical protein